jgi:hypothetical protein
MTGSEKEHFRILQGFDDFISQDIAVWKEVADEARIEVR